eukprot:scaffold85378_cov60-Phaeocystis_antarctica.AAC.1
MAHPNPLSLSLSLARSLRFSVSRRRRWTIATRHTPPPRAVARTPHSSQPGDANPHHPVGAARVAQLVSLDLLGGEAVVRLRVVLAKGEAVVELCTRWGAPTQGPA